MKPARQTLLPAFGAAALAISAALLPASALAAADTMPGDLNPTLGTVTQVMPSTAKPFGYSLTDMARLTAAFNESDRTGPPPESPFQILYDDGSGNITFNVVLGTYLYVPIAYSDDSPPPLGDFPKNVESRPQLRKYWYSQSEIGTVATDITIDGIHVELTPQYTVGIAFDKPLPSGGMNYITPAAFIWPLPHGTHKVVTHFKATGAALSDFPGGVAEFFSTYVVEVH
jgi:hypothetical protein